MIQSHMMATMKMASLRMQTYGVDSGFEWMTSVPNHHVFAVQENEEVGGEIGPLNEPYLNLIFCAELNWTRGE